MTLYGNFMNPYDNFDDFWIVRVIKVLKVTTDAKVVEFFKKRVTLMTSWQLWWLLMATLMTYKSSESSRVSKSSNKSKLSELLKSSKSSESFLVTLMTPWRLWWLLMTTLMTYESSESLLEHFQAILHEKSAKLAISKKTQNCPPGPPLKVPPTAPLGVNFFFDGLAHLVAPPTTGKSTKNSQNRPFSILSSFPYCLVPLCTAGWSYIYL